MALSEGSTLLAFFDARRGMDNPSQRALDAAIAAEKLCQKFDAELEIRVGLDSGECLIAGYPMRKRKRDEAALLGPVADLALRLADLNSHYGTRILATGAALETAGERFSRNFIGELVVEATGRKSSLYSAQEKPEGPA